ncbi:TPA: hypothetical protein ACIFE8_002182 [Yersinia enterocolitica]
MRTSGVDGANSSSGSYQGCDQAKRQSMISQKSADSFDNVFFDDVDGGYLGNIDTYTPPQTIKNEKASFGIKPSNYSYFDTKDKYLSDYLLDRVNREGQPPLLLRPLAALLALL